MSVNSLYTMPLISGDVAQAVQIRLHLLKDSSCYHLSLTITFGKTEDFLKSSETSLDFLKVVVPALRVFRFGSVVDLSLRNLWTPIPPVRRIPRLAGPSDVEIPNKKPWFQWIDLREIYRKP